MQTRSKIAGIATVTRASEGFDHRVAGHQSLHGEQPAHAEVLEVRHVEIAFRIEGQLARPVQARALGGSTVARVTKKAVTRDGSNDSLSIHAAHARGTVICNEQVPERIHRDPPRIGKLCLRGWPTVSTAAPLPAPGDGGDRTVGRDPAHPKAVELSDVQVTLRVDRKPLRAIDAGLRGRTAIARTERPPVSDHRGDRAARGNPAHAMVEAVCDVNGAVAPTNHSRGRVELGSSGRATVARKPGLTCASDGGDRVGAKVHHSYAVLRAVGNEQLARAHAEPPRIEDRVDGGAPVPHPTADDGVNVSGAGKPGAQRRAEAKQGKHRAE